MTKLEAVRAAIIKAVPEILELKFGCEVYDGLNGNGTIVGVQKYHEESDCYDIYFPKHGAEEIEFVRKPIGHLKILGRPIRLADIMLAIVKKVKEKYGTLGSKEGTITKYIDETFINLLHKYHPLTDDLSKQSPECIEFIHSILCS